MKIITWNVNSINIRLELLRVCLARHEPDIVLLQELKSENISFLQDESFLEGYNCYIHGQKSYNGVAILSKFRNCELKTNFPNNPSPEQSRFIEITCNTSIGFCRIISLYAPNGGEVNSDKFDLKLQFYDALIEYLHSIKKYDEKLLIGGDFNIAPFDIDVHSPYELNETTCFTKIERDKMRKLLNIGFYDLYRLCNQNKREFSWWDYRGGAFAKDKGLRIDTILASANAAQSFHHCFIDYSMRAKTRPSDHAPVVLW